MNVSKDMAGGWGGEGVSSHYSPLPNLCTVTGILRETTILPRGRYGPPKNRELNVRNLWPALYSAAQKSYWGIGNSGSTSEDWMLRPGRNSSKFHLGRQTWTSSQIVSHLCWAPSSPCKKYKNIKSVWYQKKNGCVIQALILLLTACPSFVTQNQKF